jgi:hypothetical protein
MTKYISYIEARLNILAIKPFLWYVKLVDAIAQKLRAPMPGEERKQMPFNRYAI